MFNAKKFHTSALKLTVIYYRVMIRYESPYGGLAVALAMFSVINYFEIARLKMCLEILL
jgi:hypothetical protein